VAIHLLNPLWDGNGGSEWRTVSLYQALKNHADVKVWTEYTPDPTLRAHAPIQEMLQLQDFPRDGTFVFVGAYWEIGRWLAQARPSRTILVYNVKDPDGLEYRLEQLEAYGIKDVELVFASEDMAAYANGRKGVVELSPIDLDRFRPRDQSLAEEGAFTVGRHSRDQTFKHHPDDPQLYKRLAQQGFEVSILGGRSLAEYDPKLSDTPGIHIHEAGFVDAVNFLHSVDAFVYRTNPSWFEPYGRVVVEAMACGLPCVLENRGGYTSLIRHRENGFLVSSQEEAFDTLTTLRDDPELRRRVALGARGSIFSLYEDQRRKILDFYLRGR